MQNNATVAKANIAIVTKRHAKMRVRKARFEAENDEMFAVRTHRTDWADCVRETFQVIATPRWETMTDRNERRPGTADDNRTLSIAP